jgi:hypothetical protein
LATVYLAAQQIVAEVRYGTENLDRQLSDFAAPIWLGFEGLSGSGSLRHVAIWPTWAVRGGVVAGQAAELDELLSLRRNANVVAGLVVRPARSEENVEIERSATILSLAIGVQGRSLWEALDQLTSFISEWYGIDLMRRISGLDINGWKDVAARDWEPDEPEGHAATTKVLDGGFGSAVVQQNSGEWIGGPQALRAPHGRGLGWGAIGAPERRVSIAEVVEELSATGSARFGALYEPAVNALARGAEDVILAVPDVPEFNEAAQGRMLTTFQGDRRAFRLLWRPVAAFLYALESGLIPEHAEGQVFCVS